MAKKSIKPKNSKTKYYLYSLITLFIAVRFYLFSEFYQNFSSEKTKSGTVSKMEQMVAIDEIDYSKLDDSICMLKKVTTNSLPDLIRYKLLTEIRKTTLKFNGDMFEEFARPIKL